MLIILCIQTLVLKDTQILLANRQVTGTINSFFIFYCSECKTKINGAYETRTRHPQIANLMLYQMS